MSKIANTQISDNILKKRIIDRILRNTELYTRQELSNMTKLQLVMIQDSGLIRFNLILKFKNRKKIHFKQL
jgi:hypothetical protein